ncbi:MAG: hypothetical protein Q8M20_18130 [Rhodocyclaceae bacterium]|nr:hypothetical protein [Rhodocyclaceae bacterium]
MATKPTRSKKPVVAQAATDQPNTPLELSTGAVDNPIPDVPVADAISDDVPVADDITDDLEPPWLAGNLDDQGDIDNDIDSDDVTELVVELVTLHRDEPQHEGGPLDADVHPDEIDNYLAAGWVR